MAAVDGNWVKHGAALLLACTLAACGSPADPPPAQTEAGAAASAPAGTLAAAAGSKPAAFTQCAACHAVVPGKNGIGPTLVGVFGRTAGTMPGFAYSKAMTAYGASWDETTLDAFLAAPMKTVPGTKMSYAGLSNGAKRKELIEYLKTLE